MKKKGFTLVELLAVIVVLAIILVIAVPRILDIIKDSRVGALESSVKLVAKSAEQKLLENQILDIDGTISCNKVVDINSEDYESCEISFNNGEANIVLVGKENGKFGEMLCEGTKDDIVCSGKGIYTVVFNSNGGTGKMKPQSINEGNVLSLNTFTKSGYTFAGWRNVLYFSPEEISRNSEFMQYVDLAPYFDKYGVDKNYHLELDLKSADVTNKNSIMVYFQNGSSSRYSFTSNKTYTVTTDWMHVSFDFKAKLATETDERAMLAFYGTYNTGNKPIVKNVELSLLPNFTDGEQISNIEMYNNIINLKALWQANS